MSSSDFVANPDGVYAFVGRFFASLREAGVREVVLSPGSRSTPLSISADRTPGLRTFIGLDERAAAFFALGLAKAGRRPAVLVCTSGTAAANYLPAIVEAHYSRVPLIVLTADRPPELRDWGAGQTIEQSGLYGAYSRWSVEVPIEVGGDDALRYATRLAARSVAMASDRPAGAVHLNWPFREPLAPPLGIGAPDVDGVDDARERYDANTESLRFSRAAAVASVEDVRELASLATGRERGVICCGPMDADPGMVEAIVAFARVTRWPIFADPASQIRRADSAQDATILDAGDAITRVPDFAARMRPDVVLRFGETPVSKAQRLWLEASEVASVWWFDEGGSWGEPSHRATRVVRGGAESALRQATERIEGRVERKGDWCETFETLNVHARDRLAEMLRGDAAGSGLGVAETVCRHLPADAQLFASNSMAIRLLDLALENRSDGPRVLCNRGASGIDGVTASALGAAAAEGCPTLLLTGDLAFLHDLGALLFARHETIPLVIVVLDDNGGGIFSFLPVAEQAEAVGFDRLFRTPHDLDLAKAAALFELEYQRVDAIPEFEPALDRALASPTVSIVHVPLEAKENEARFRACLADLRETIVEVLDS